VLLECGSELLDRCVEGLLVGVLEIAEALVRYDDGLDALRAHDGTESAAPGEAVRIALHVRDRDARGLQAHLAGRAVRDGRVLVVRGTEGLDRVGHRIVALAGPLIDPVHLGRAVGLDREHVARLVVCRLPGEHDGGDPELGECVRGLTAGVRLLEATGQRALRADGQPAAVRSRRSAEQAGGEHEHVVGAERVGRRRDHLVDECVRQRAAAIAGPRVRQGLPAHRER